MTESELPKSIWHRYGWVIGFVGTFGLGFGLYSTQKKQELMSQMGDEIYCARALESLPVEKRTGYYDENVIPLKEKEKRALTEWAAIAREAQAKGVSWSDAV